MRRSLGLLDNDDYFAWLVFSAPIDDQTWRAGQQSVIDEYGNSYLQAGGTAGEDERGAAPPRGRRRVPVPHRRP
ncbi:hypothetical protein Q9Q99_09630 [Curtobacterium flaccumfaciens]|nr:hypothetical protein Q9Q99_09630 [Curtobacterium flaccumfaciens]